MKRDAIIKFDMEYDAMLRSYRVEDVAAANDADDAHEWSESCKAIARAESNYFERFAPHAYDTEREEAMGFT
jgi:hypothetical protein